jgi:hypothetical protein
MADKKSKAAETKEDSVYAAEEATSVVSVSQDSSKLNTLSVVSIASAATGFGAVAGIITGHVALSQLRHTAEKGRGLAIAGLITGYVGIAGFALMSALAIGGHWGENQMHGPRNGFAYTQVDPQQGGQFGGMMGGHFGGRGQDDQGFGMMGGQNGQMPGQIGNVQVGPGQMGQGGATITLPNGQTITIPNGADGGFGGMMGGNGGQIQPTPIPSAVQGN